MSSMNRRGFRPGSRLAGCAALATLCIGCSERRPERASNRWDSAGVEVVTHAWAGGSIDTSEVVRLPTDTLISDIDLPDSLAFGRLVDLSVGPNGRIHVLDQFFQQVQVFLEGGTFLGTIGRPGSGPREFGGGVSQILAWGGGFSVPDYLNHRITRFDWTGASIEAWPLPPELPGLPVKWGVDTRGRILIQSKDMPGAYFEQAGFGGDDGLTGDGLLRYQPDSKSFERVLVLPEGRVVDRDVSNSGKLRLFDSEPFWAAAADGHIVFGVNSIGEIFVSDSVGCVERVIRLAIDPEPVSSADRELGRDLFLSYLRNQGVPESGLGLISKTLEIADHYPLFSGIFLGPASSIWLQMPRSLSEISDPNRVFGQENFNLLGPGSQRWIVLKSNGDWVGMVALPEDFQPKAHFANRIYGIVRDKLDRQQIVVALTEGIFQ